MMVGEVEAASAVVPPGEYSQPWPNVDAPVPPPATVRVPVMVGVKVRVPAAGMT